MSHVLSMRFCSYPTIIHVAAGRGCARAVHAAIIHGAGVDMDAIYGAYVAAASNTYKTNSIYDKS